MNPTLNHRSLFVCGIFAVCLTVVSARLIYIQHVRHDYYTAKVLRSGTTYEEVISPRRGDILDRNLEVLASTHPITQLYLNLHHLPTEHQSFNESRLISLAVQETGQSEETFVDYSKSHFETLYLQLLAKRLSRPLQTTEAEMFKRITSGLKYLPIGDPMDSDSARQFVDDLRAEGYVGLEYKDRSDRFYPNGGIACHVLGFVTHDLKGAEGVEKGMDDFLLGENGTRIYDENRHLVNEILPQDGKHVVLTIDLGFQTLVEEIVDRHYIETRAESISVVLAHPQTGEILAMVNRPGFSPASPGEAEPSARINRAVSSVYEPGSTFKLVAHSSAIDRGLVKLSTIINCHGGLYTEPGWMKPLVDLSRRDRIPVRDVIAISSNVGTFMVAQQLDPETYYNYILSYGFGQKPDLYLTGEQSGMVPHPDKWKRSRLDLSRLAMGYIMNASPVQVLNIANVVCNGGSLVKLRLLKEIRNPETREVSARPEISIVENVISAKTAQAMQQAMIHTVQVGSGKQANLPGYVVGGKTGTADRHVPGKGYIGTGNMASFIGFVGTLERPELIGVVVVEDPKTKKRQGGDTAAPIFNELAEMAMFYFGVPAMSEEEAATLGQVGIVTGGAR